MKRRVKQLETEVKNLHHLHQLQQRVNHEVKETLWAITGQLMLGDPPTNAPESPTQGQ